MPIDTTRIGLHVLRNAAGVTISSHADLKEAYARASRAPDGVYDLVTANERIVVTGNTAAPAPAPVPPPPPPAPA
ncbi:MAG: hypothetical protein ABL916_23885, partial [Burkholderiaceae bacterium]